MTEQPDDASYDSLNDYLKPPAITADVAARSRYACTRIALGDNTINTCNPAVGDVDGDGLDELAIPFNRGEQDVVALFKGDGEVVWETTDVRLYHSFYRRPEQYLHSHWHYRSRHRHLLTQIRDVDGDGELEVIVGDGPLYVLDGRDGHIKRVFDLGGCAQVWSTAKLVPSGPPGIVACVNRHEQGGHVIAIDGNGDTLWRHDTPGQSFEDRILCGDLTGDGLDETAFSMADESRFEVRDSAGELLWSKHVPSQVGEDTHVDDMVIAPIRAGARQLATSTGGCLFDAEGALIWRLGDRIEHGQKVAVAFPPGREGARIYINSKTGGKAYCLNSDGEVLWEYDNFSRAPDQAILLTTAADWVDWSAPGSCEMVQSEIFFAPRRLPAPEMYRVPLWLTVLSAEGEQVACIPYTDCLRPGFNGAMCALSCHAVSRDRHDVLVITHNSSEALVFSPLV